MKSLQIENIDVNEFTELIRGIIKGEIAEVVKTLSPQHQDELMSRKDVMKLLDISASTLRNMREKGKLKPNGLGNRVYFYRSEVLAAIKPLKAA